MTRIDYAFPAPERVVVGTIGQPGERAFYLQARQENRICSVLLEKQQAAVLADAVEELLDEQSPDDSRQSSRTPVDVAPLDVPLTEEFRVMRLTLGWSPADSMVRIEAWSVEDADDPDEADDADTVQVLTVAMSASYAREFIRRTRAVVAAGRRACPVCEQPMQPEGHICPRANGYHRLARG